MKYIAYTSTRSPGLLQKAAALVVTVAVAAVVLVFSSVFLAVLAVAAIVGGAWVWWQTRHVRKIVREMRASMKRARGEYGRGPFGPGSFGQGPFQGPFGGQAGEPAQSASPAREARYEGVVIEGEAVRVDEHGSGR